MQYKRHRVRPDITSSSFITLRYAAYNTDQGAPTTISPVVDNTVTVTLRQLGESLSGVEEKEQKEKV